MNRNKIKLTSPRGTRLLLTFNLLFLLTACGSDARNVAGDPRPRLVQEVTLPPAALAPTRFLTPTPSPILIPVSTSEMSTSLPVMTVPSGFLLVTPTLPPSKTPTVTPSQTMTPTVRPTVANLAVLTPAAVAPTALPPQPSLYSTAVSINPPSQVCAASWFFSQPLTQSCPSNPPLVSQAAYQQFQQGFMLWIQAQSAIYVFYDSANLPRWEVFRDTFQEGMPDQDPALDPLAPPYTWQPRRGFGLVWRLNPGVQQRIGWAVREYEETYLSQIQTAQDGTIFLQEIRGAVISLSPGGQGWERWIGL